MKKNNDNYMAVNSAENVTIEEIQAKDKSKFNILTKLKKMKDKKIDLPPIDKDRRPKPNHDKEQPLLPNIPYDQMNLTFPSYQQVLNNPDMPTFLKNSIQKKTEALISFNVSDKIDFDDYCNLKNFKDYFDRLYAENKIIKYLNFDSIDCLTDSVFYIFYKYFNINEMWKILEKITLDSCRYITDFGIDLMCSGCVNIFNHFYHTKSKDLFQNENFGSYYCNGSFYEKRLDSNIYKRKNLAQKISVSNMNQRLAINSSSSILVIFLDFDSYKDSVDFMEDLTSKFLDILNQNQFWSLDARDLISDDKKKNQNKAVVYLKIVLAVKNCSVNEVVDKLIENLKRSVESIVDDEKEFCESLEKTKFFEQEAFRDKFRLKFKTEKLIENSSIIKFINLQDNSMDKLLEEINSDLEKRYESEPFKILANILKQQSASKKIIELEDFLNECFDCQTFDFKSKLQGAQKGRLIEDFLTFRNFLGECLLFELANGQTIIVPDIKWFFNQIQSTINYLENSKLIKYDSTKNIHLVNMYLFYQREFLDQLNLDDKNFKIFVQLLEKFNILSKTGNMNERFLFSKYLANFKERSKRSYKEFWPKNQDGSLKIRSTFDFYFKLPEQILNELMSKFFLLPNIYFKNDNCLICQEGSMNLCLLYEESKKQIHLILRTVDLSLLVDKTEFEQTLKNLNKMIIVMFNEYKIVCEAFLISKKIPFKYGSVQIENQALRGKITTNLNDEFIAKN
ncbi:hypothetical protein BpHYR1_034678 [Brachionus plicatilis]|uniref:Uncharacterized protein n=1 Tax=Brachionus plicatilis TaxID=10195 RepID=A0A3M7SHP3_BRAPC|nr:hypothetical protein BpHYR1_034678 [Brachionus plicatilis]